MYLINLFKHNKFMFFGIVLFCVLQIGATIKYENIPFLNYGMYSEKFDFYNELETSYYAVYSNAQMVDFKHLSHQKQVFFENSITNYQRIEDNNFKDFNTSFIQHEINSFLSPQLSKSILSQLNYEKSLKLEYPIWLKSNLAEKINVAPSSLSVYEHQVKLHKGRFQEIGKKQLF